MASRKIRIFDAIHDTEEVIEISAADHPTVTTAAAAVAADEQQCSTRTSSSASASSASSRSQPASQCTASDEIDFDRVVNQAADELVAACTLDQAPSLALLLKSSLNPANRYQSINRISSSNVPSLTSIRRIQWCRASLDRCNVVEHACAFLAIMVAAAAKTPSLEDDRLLEMPLVVPVIRLLRNLATSSSAQLFILNNELVRELLFERLPRVLHRNPTTASRSSTLTGIVERHDAARSLASTLTLTRVPPTGMCRSRCHSFIGSIALEHHHEQRQDAGVGVGSSAAVATAVRLTASRTST